MPIALSLSMFALILFLLAIQGVPAPDPNADEGVGAHFFQLWLVYEFFAVGLFAIKWLPQKPKEALPVLLFQTLAVVSACAPVFLLGL